MPLTNAERQALWRQKQRERAHEEYKQKERERYQKKKERGTVKPVSEMSAREKRKTRRQWRKNQKSKRDKDRKITESLKNSLTPPTSPEIALVNHQAQQLGRKKVRKDRAKAYREIFKLRIALQKETRLKEKYKKQSQRFKRKIKKSTTEEESKIIKNYDLRKSILFYHTIVQNITKRYQRLKSYKQRKFISSLICSYDLIRKYRLGQYAKETFGFTRYQAKTSCNSMRKPIVKVTRIKASVVDFFERDDNSRLKADKKATITRNGQKKQVRLLNDDLKHLHKKYVAEGQRRISYSLFCKFRPFWVIPPTSKDRDTCLCRLHDNLKYKLEKAHMENLFHTKHIDDLAKKLTCNQTLDNKQCMYRECDECKDKTLQMSTPNLNLGKQTTWKVWKSRKVEFNFKAPDGQMSNKMTNRVVKETEKGTLESLSREINNEMLRICSHIFNIRQQYTAMRFLKEHLEEDDLLIHVDFSENYACKYNAEIQSVHFGASQRQISLHTGLAYTKHNTLPFATISDNLKHSPAAIWAHIGPVLNYLNKSHSFKAVHFLSDGPTTQYRNKQNMYLLSSTIFDFGFEKATWNFLEAGHGKGAADGVGAVIKRTADRLVETNMIDVMCAGDLAKALESSKVKIFQIKEDDIDAIEKLLPVGILPIPKTMKIHQVIVKEKLVINSRVVSCFCSHPNSCHCFGLSETTLYTSNEEKIQRKNGAKESELSYEIQQHTSHMTSVASSSQDKNLTFLEEISEELIGKFVVVKYDDSPYPGMVMDVDENELEVKVMHNIGKNKFFWPHPIDDILWYTKESVITILDEEPKQVTGRHCQINPETWKLIEISLDL